MKDIRIFYQKTGRAAYISHLDLNRTMQRAVKRSQIPAWYTQGFNPHIYMTFALPLSLGFNGLCESMDLRLTEDDFSPDAVKEQMNAVMPEGLTVIGVGEQTMAPQDIYWADYKVSLELEGIDSQKGAELFFAFTALPEILAMKKGKKGDKEIDLKPLFLVKESETVGDNLTLVLRVRSGGTLNINPSLIVDSFCAWFNLSYLRCEITRFGIYNENGTIFM